MIRRLFASRVALQVLGMFVVAAGAPMLLLAALSQSAVDASLARSEAVQVGATAKTAGLQTLERLRLAREALAGNRAAAAPARQLAPLRGVVEIDAQGRRSVQKPEAPDTPVATLLALPKPEPEAPRLQTVDLPGAETPAVVLVEPGAGGSVRLGLVDPAFLWAGTGELPAELWLCALAHDGRVLFCSDPQRADAARARLLESRRAAPGQPSAAVKGLFLRADFAEAKDWNFVAGYTEDQGDSWIEALGGSLPVAAAAGLLLALLLGLIQTRRTMQPLTLLAKGARAIARRRFDTRLDIHSADEFGQVAGAFNEMTARLQAQFAELEALAAIDRQIVGHHALQEVHAVVLARLQQLLPRRAVLLAHVPDERQPRALCLLAGPGPGVPVELPLALDPARCAHLHTAADAEWLPLPHDAASDPQGERLPAGLRGAQAIALQWRGRCFGFLAVGPGENNEPIDGDTLRQLLDLRNRAAIAASSAQREQTLWREARYDGATGLLNRHGLDEQLRRLVGACGPGATLAILYLDLDRFKHINDSLGHAAGDAALAQVAERLRQRLPEGGLAARPAGDEFVVLLPGLAHSTAATALAQSLCENLAQGLLVQQQRFVVRASVGVCLCTDPQADPATLLRSADQAMYRAKQRGGGRYAMFDSRLDAEALRRTWIENDLALAGSRGELQLVYQPRYDLARHRIGAVEALLRWQHPVHGLCLPGEFIAIAEESELIEEVGRWVIDAACAQLRRWRDDGVAELRVAINLSARQLASEHLCADLLEALARHRIRPEWLELEITESLLVEQTEATLARLHELRRLGLSLALDDFGTGYSSMSYLRSLPIETLKIDRAFVRDLGHDRAALAVAHAIVALASSLGLRTVAEGVETPEQWRALEDLHCDEVQGYLFSRPVDAASIARLLAEPIDAPRGSATPALQSCS